MRDAQRIESITSLPVAEVVERNRLRPVSEAGVKALLSSIEDLGSITDPIHVRKVKHRKGELVLMAGAHRLEAARRLGWETIPAFVWDCSDDWAMLKEIDDNSAGAELTALDTAIFLAERKRVYERLHPETRADAFRGNQHTGNLAAEPGSVATFASATSEKFGISERQVRKIVAAGSRLDPRDRQLLRSAPRPISLKDLTEIGKIGETGERYHVVEALSQGTAKTAAEARKAWRQRGRGEVPISKADAQFRKIEDVWGRSLNAVKRDFVAAHRDELQALLDALGGDDA